MSYNPDYDAKWEVMDQIREYEQGKRLYLTGQAAELALRLLPEAKPKYIFIEHKSVSGFKSDPPVPYKK